MTDHARRDNAERGAEGVTGLPGWLKPVNRVIELLQRLGIAFLTFHLLSVPGRKSDRMRTTPVSPFEYAGGRYLVSFGKTEWVKNARASGWGVLARGRRQQKVRLLELSLAERVPILRQFPVLVPYGVQFFVRVGAVKPPADADSFAAAAPQLSVFRVEPVADNGSSSSQPVVRAGRDLGLRAAVPRSPHR
jgi:hypothetical protein